MCYLLLLFLTAVSCVFILNLLLKINIFSVLLFFMLLLADCVYLGETKLLSLFLF